MSVNFGNFHIVQINLNIIDLSFLIFKTFKINNYLICRYRYGRIKPWFCPTNCNIVLLQLFEPQWRRIRRARYLNKQPLGVQRWLGSILINCDPHLTLCLVDSPDSRDAHCLHSSCRLFACFVHWLWILAAAGPLCNRDDSEGRCICPPDDFQVQCLSQFDIAESIRIHIWRQDLTKAFAIFDQLKSLN